ncbi:hypothetical protein GQ53DRAFT_786086 [Thozetella sp. PMI_491]|nr:hypothetical protein GQ53DRAFT_786086 [Thozetella sp. PMI_491]
MIIDGEKYACEACVRGHRVSNCQHADRKLQHINKKGRPVTQCSHCRAMRKSRASHVKCDCGEKTHKCIHLQTTLEGHRESCCCNHGGRCTCSHKKESQPLDTVPESDSEQEYEATGKAKTERRDARTRRRADTTRSEGSILSFDSNGHHKPTHKLIKSSQRTGPYQLTRANSLQNRSADNLAGLPYSESPTDGSSNGFNDGARERRKSKSTAGSPLMTGSSLAQLNGQLPPLDLSAIEYPPYVPNSADFFGNLSDHEQPIFSAGLSTASVDWSHYDGLEFASKTADFAPSNYSQPQSFGGFEFSGSEQLASLTTNTSNSGEVSEVEDFLPSTLDEFDTNPGFRDSAPGSTLNLNGTQAGMLDAGSLGDMDFNDLKFMKAESKFLPTASTLSGEDPTLLSTTAAGDFGLDASEFLWDINGLQSMADTTNDFWPQ